MSGLRRAANLPGVAVLNTIKHQFQVASSSTAAKTQQASTTDSAAKNESQNDIQNSSATDQGQKPQKSQKSQTQLDEELRLKMAGLAGDGGESGVEYEDGQPTAMKRSVRDNMFRYI